MNILETDFAEKLDIKRIAEENGFEDSNYFSRMFRKETGLSPRDYRRTNAPGGPGPVPPKSPDMSL